MLQLYRHGGPDLRASAKQVALSLAARPDAVRQLVKELCAASALPSSTHSRRKRRRLALAVKYLCSVAAAIGPLLEADAVAALAVELARPGNADEVLRPCLAACALLLLHDAQARRQMLRAEHDARSPLARLEQLLLDKSTEQGTLHWAVVAVHTLITLREAPFTPGSPPPTCSLSSSAALGMARALRLLAPRTQGNNDLQQLVLHALLVLATSEPHGPTILATLADRNLVHTAIQAMRSGERELVFWSLGIIYELGVKGTSIGGGRGRVTCCSS
jgi:hypothetical protein